MLTSGLLFVLVDDTNHLLDRANQMARKKSPLFLHIVADINAFRLSIGVRIFLCTLSR